MTEKLLCRFGNDHSVVEPHKCPYLEMMVKGIELKKEDSNFLSCQCCKSCEQLCVGAI